MRTGSSLPPPPRGSRRSRRRSRRSSGPPWIVRPGLLDNGRKAGPPIRVAVGPTPDGARISVADEGAGVDPEVLDRLGEPFLTRWPTPGAGLGLFVARSFAVDVGGDLTLEPRQPHGTVAHLLLSRSAI